MEPPEGRGYALLGNFSANAAVRASVESCHAELSVSTRVSGLSHAWDVKQIDGGRLLITALDPERFTVAHRNGSTYAFR